ncbi:MAG TPA: DUF5362 family protein [Chitinophagaceae bacterium]|nr:DUF5362 family protein [Chitinophagaceae bacterium]
MENQQHSDNLFSIPIDQEGKELIRTIAWWARLIAIIAFIGYAVSIIVSFMKPDMVINDEVYSTSRTSSVVGAIIAAAIGIAINSFLFKFGNSARAGVDSMDTGLLSDAFNNLRIYYKILGIIVIICLVLFGLVFLFAMLGALVGSN